MYFFPRLARFAGFIFWVSSTLGFIFLYFAIHTKDGEDTAMFLMFMTLACAYVCFFAVMGWLGSWLIYFLGRPPRR